MKTVRNGTFLVFVLVMFAADGRGLLALTTPPFANCSDGCTCTVNPNEWLEVTAECPDVAPADECPLGYAACDDYCFFLGGYLKAVYPQNDFSCGLYEFLGDCEGTYSLEPPTEWLCGCFCWVS
jgi:hypothetical protein